MVHDYESRLLKDAAEGQQAAQSFRLHVRPVAAQSYSSWVPVRTTHGTEPSAQEVGSVLAKEEFPKIQGGK